MKRMLLVVMMAFSFGAAHAGEKQAPEVNLAPMEACQATQPLVTPAQPRDSSAEALTCSRTPCVVCYSKIRQCRAGCASGDTECLANCEYECQYCCY
ncbi:hypothetical protein POL68_26305 [Stigmatella sp. ncwal1]|uniref:Uncharacterized protein n=1 Tax=Stigmatella ashevillensis TaxID=2995309 RepID=A0ABT5DGW7_9BACT|nr:hypothetical protein [Stigmatella ashevillena]MDC0712008.1 hypothetical protein [Stigmatella ashevillena]